MMEETLHLLGDDGGSGSGGGGTDWIKITLDYICPSIGVILATFTFAAPVASLREALDRGRLGELNTTPWAYMTGNCLGFLGYSFVTGNLFVLFANAPGLMISIWLNMGAIQLQYLINMDRSPPEESDIYVRLNNSHNHNNDGGGELLNGGGDGGDESSQRALLQSQRDKHELHLRAPTTEQRPSSNPKRAFSLFIVAWLIIFSVVALAPWPHNVRQDVMGVAANINLAFFYGAPLSTIALVLQTKSSSSIHRRTMILNTTNTAFWSVYGLAILDPFIYVPNIIGLVLGMLQVVLCCCYPRRIGVSEEGVGEEEDDDENVVGGLMGGHQQGGTSMSDPLNPDNVLL